ncbi:MAG: hypothetical protein GX604_06335 [Actinobacteria bacterium]|nr:hypothetical protein [Actinomycetota bacterium]
MFHRPALRGLGVVCMLLAMTFVLVSAAPAMAFPDVPDNHAYARAIDELSSRGIIGGYTDGNFGLDDPVKRAQFAKMIVGTLGVTPNTSTTTRFTDLGAPDAAGYPHRFVQTAYDNGITYGTNTAQTLFSPWSFIQRDQVASMVVRGISEIAPGSLLNPPEGISSLFAGVPEPHGKNLRIAEHNGLLDGLMGLGSGWSVTAPATRGEVAQMLNNVLDLTDGLAGEPIKDGVARADGVTLSADIPDGSAALTVAPAPRDLFEGNAASDVATIEYAELIDSPVTVSLPMHENDGGLYMLGVGTEVYGTVGEPVTLYRFYDVQVAEGVATASFVPADALSEEVRFQSSGDVGLRPPWLRTSTALFSVGRKVASGPEGTTHFRLTYPKHRQGKDYFTQDDLIALFGVFEDTFDMYQNTYGYGYAARTKYPLDVYIVPLGENGDGEYSQGYSVNSGTITLNTRLFYSGQNKNFDPKAGKQGRVPAVFTHEFFHFVQANYVSQRSSCLWLDEATATYHESLKGGGALDSIDRMGNWKLMYDGIFPPSDTAKHGYARMPLIEFLVNKTGGPEFIHDLYTGHTSGWEKAIVTETKLQPADYAVDFYSDLLQQKVTSYRTPAAIFWGALGAEGKPEDWEDPSDQDSRGVCSLWQPTIPEYEKVRSRLEQEGELGLGEASLKVPAYGARLFALQLFTSQTALNAYPDELEIQVRTSSPGCEMKLLEIHGQDTTFLDEATITDPKSKIGHGYDYLVLAVSLSAQPVDVKVEAYAVTGDPQEYVWGLVNIQPYRSTQFGQSKLLGQDLHISASPGSCSLEMNEKMLGRETIRSAVYTMPAYLEPNKPYQPSIPVTHSNFEFYCLFDGVLDLGLNADQTVLAHKNKNGLAAPGSGAGAGSETHTIMVGMFYSNMKVGAEYVYKWMPKKDVGGAGPS